MGRKKNYDIKQVLFDMGTVFIENGYEATSLDDLEKETGLLRGSLYREFGSKRTMFELSLKEYLNRNPQESATLDLLLIGFLELSPRDYKLRKFLRNWYFFYSKNGASVSKLLGDRLIDRAKILSEGEGKDG
ncbi:transcriptional regulator, TetR family [Weissella bombi]|uniref:Transcriptional regulator, TetR family n=2 Tax=Weissella bombi TaxID=1505725 RepID=A0A1C3YYG0_9LACO|nr:transcriptional regulator, TetR family [Weissella bombi]